MTYARIDIDNATTADLLPVFNKWLANAMPGAVALYHDGYLAAYRPPNGPADAAMAASKAGLVHLVQLRVGPRRFHYYAIRAKALPVKAERLPIRRVRHMAEVA